MSTSSSSVIGASSSHPFLKNDGLLLQEEVDLPSCCNAVYHQISRIERRVERIEKVSVRILAAVLLSLVMLGLWLMEHKEVGSSLFTSNTLRPPHQSSIISARSNSGLDFLDDDDDDEKKEISKNEPHSKLLPSLIFGEKKKQGESKELQESTIRPKKENEFSNSDRIKVAERTQRVNVHSPKGTRKSEEYHHYRTSTNRGRKATSRLIRQKETRRNVAALTPTTAPTTTTKDSSGASSAYDAVECYPPNGANVSNNTNETHFYHVNECPDGHVLLELEMNLAYTSPDFSWMLRNETTSRSGPDVDNILLQIKSDQYKDTRQQFYDSSGGAGTSTSSSSSSPPSSSTTSFPYDNYNTTLCTYSMCLPTTTAAISLDDSINSNEKNTSPSEGIHDNAMSTTTATETHYRYSLTLFNRNQCREGIPCSPFAITGKLCYDSNSYKSENKPCYSLKINGEEIIRGEQNFDYVTSRWFQYSPSVPVLPSVVNMSNGTSSINSSNTFATSNITYKWSEIEQSTTSICDDEYLKGRGDRYHLFSPISEHTGYKFNKRIFEITEILSSTMSGTGIKYNKWQQDSTWSATMNDTGYDSNTLTNKNKEVDDDGTFHRKKALCWILHEDRRQIASTDPLLIQRYSMVVTHFATEYALDFHREAFTHSGNECDWFMFETWGDSCISIASSTTAQSNVTNDDDGSRNTTTNSSASVTLEEDERHVRRIITHQGRWVSGTIPYEMFTGLPFLESVKFDYNLMHGTIPSEIDAASKLVLLDLEHNQFSGSIPSQIGRLKGLTGVYFNNNFFISGTIPSEIFSLPLLDELTLSNNQLTGTIPSDVGNAASLTGLWLEGNRLVGTLPRSLFIGCTQLKTLELSQNSLIGSIPHDIRNLRNLQTLNIENNNFNGSLPVKSLSPLTDLTTLIMRGNNLSGTIPSEIGKAVENITFLSLSFNRLTGSIPQEFGELKEVISLQLSDNDLSGTIPESLWDLSFVPPFEYIQYVPGLDLENNLYLEGKVPSNFCDKFPFGRRVNVDDSSWMGLPSVNCTCCQTCDEGGIKRLRRDRRHLLLTLNSNANSDTAPTVTSSDPIIAQHERGMINCPLPKRKRKNNTSDMSDNNGMGFSPNTRINVAYSDDFEIEDLNHAKNRTIFRWVHQNMRPVWGLEPAAMDVCLPLTGCYKAKFHTYFDNDTTMEEAWISPFTVTNNHEDVLGALSVGQYVPSDQKYVEFEFGLYIETTEKTSTTITSSGTTSNTNITTTTKRLSLQRGSCDTIYACGMSFSPGSIQRQILNHLFHFTLMEEDWNNGIGTFLDDDLSARTQALCFVVKTILARQQNREGLINNNVESNNSTLSSSEGRRIIMEEQLICTGQLVQLYVLALLMFNNHAWEEEFKLNGQYKTLDDWPTSKVSMASFYCRWPGIMCYPSNDDDNRAIIVHVDISNRNLSGTLPLELSLLDGLESLVLRSNAISGTLPDSLSLGLKVLDLNNNQIGGTVDENFLLGLPNLQMLDLSQNLLEGRIGIAEHSLKNLNFLNISSNFFTGTIPSFLFEKTKLRHIDLSRNGFTGKIPLSLSNDRDVPDMISSNPNHNSSVLETFAAHENSLTGALPRWLFSPSLLPELKTLWLHSNQLTGSIPTEVGLIKKLESLTLSHNSFRGQIPSSYLSNNTNLKKLHLHGNMLTGTITSPQLNHLKDGSDRHAFIADCGSPFFSLPSKIRCDSCTICCNSEGMCQDNTPYQTSIVQQTLIFLSSVVVVILLFLFALAFVRKVLVLTERCHSLPLLKDRQFGVLCGTKSIYSLLLSSSYVGWCLYIVTLALQIMTFSIFFDPADFRHDNSDWQYSKRCSSNSVECEDESNVTPFGWFMFAVVLSSKLAVDIFNGFVILYKGMICFHVNASATTTCGITSSNNSASVRIRIFVSGAALIIITSLAAWTSVVYNRATASADTELVYNAVILLFVNELDELFYTLVASAAPKWLNDRSKEIMRTSSSPSSENNHECPVLPHFMQPDTSKGRSWTREPTSGLSQTAVEDNRIQRPKLGMGGDGTNTNQFMGPSPSIIRQTTSGRMSFCHDTTYSHSFFVRRNST